MQGPRDARVKKQGGADQVSYGQKEILLRVQSGASLLGVQEGQFVGAALAAPAAVVWTARDWGVPAAVLAVTEGMFGAYRCETGLKTKYAPEALVAGAVVHLQETLGGIVVEVQVAEAWTRGAPQLPSSTTQQARTFWLQYRRGL